MRVAVWIALVGIGGPVVIEDVIGHHGKSWTISQGYDEIRHCQSKSIDECSLNIWDLGRRLPWPENLIRVNANTVEPLRGVERRMPNNGGEGGSRVRLG